MDRLYTLFTEKDRSPFCDNLLKKQPVVIIKALTLCYITRLILALVNISNHAQKSVHATITVAFKLHFQKVIVVYLYSL